MNDECFVTVLSQLSTASHPLIRHETEKVLEMWTKS